MRMQIESIHSFTQEDENDYCLEVLALFGDEEWEVRLHMDTTEVVRLHQLISAAMGRYLAEMQFAKASYQAGEGPNGEPRGTWGND